jgi:hypothetical protein
LAGWSNRSSEKSRNATRRMFRTTTMFRGPPVCALTTQIASICVSNANLQQFFVRESHPNSFVVHNFTAKTSVEPDGPGRLTCPHSLQASDRANYAFRGREECILDLENAVPASQNSARVFVNCYIIWEAGRVLRMGRVLGKQCSAACFLSQA